jgi:hypothetical protein
VSLEEFGLSRGDIDCILLEKDMPVRVSDSGFVHLRTEKISPETLCDMINNKIMCPEHVRKQRIARESIRICARRQGKTYGIILALDHAYDVDEDVYLVTHLKPV